MKCPICDQEHDAVTYAGWCVDCEYEFAHLDFDRRERYAEWAAARARATMVNKKPTSDVARLDGMWQQMVAERDALAAKLKRVEKLLQVRWHNDAVDKTELRRALKGDDE